MPSVSTIAVTSMTHFPEWPRWRRSVFIAAGLLVLPTVILAGAWRLGGVSALEDDLLYYLPIRQYIGERLADGEWPMWNTLVGMGTSVAADPQSGLWYPPTYLFAVLPPLVAYPLTLILHFALAGWGMYRFLRASGREWQAAFLGAVAFEFCGFLIAHRVHLTMHHAVAWIPWILYAWRRFADTGAYRHFTLAAGAFGLQMLVQHTQISLMTAIIVTAYVAVVLLPAKRSLLWQYPVGMILGGAVGAVQTIPAFLHLRGSGRGVATFSTFVENSWEPASAVLMLFPMLYGNRTPTFWGQEWWGLSHFCEQFAYGSIAILLLAVASYSLLFVPRHSSIPPSASGATGVPQVNIFRREVVFWWAASGGAFLLALGDLNPLSKLLFELPIYGNLRVPARWILVWSLAMPILASAVISVLRRGGPAGQRVGQALRTVGTRVLPTAAIACILLVSLARWCVDDLEVLCEHRWGYVRVLSGLRSAIRPDNPALLWPVVMMAASVALLLRWTTRPSSRSLAVIGVLVVIDLASVAAFVDVDTRTYDRQQLTSPPPLARMIDNLDPEPGHRLLVPRYQADYERPLEVLWPQTNMHCGIPTFNAYGPFSPKAHRLLFRFMPWGSSEAMLELLRRPKLCAAMGIRFVAARTPEELGIVSDALLPNCAEPATHFPETGDWVAVESGNDLRWPVQIDQPGVYRLQFEAAPGPDNASQWFVRLETPDMREIGFTRRLEPVDLSKGPRRLEFLFVCDEPIGQGLIRVKSERGHALSVRSGSFGCVAAPEQQAAVPPPAHLILRGTTSDGVSLFEPPEAEPLIRIGGRTRAVGDVQAAVDQLLGEDPSEDSPPATIYEWLEEWGDPPVLGETGTVVYDRVSGHELRITTECPRDTLVVFNETYDPGWRAWIDGDPTRLYRVNAVVQGVIVPPGASEILLRYRPRGQLAGLILSLGALAVLGGAALVRPRRTAQADRTPTSSADGFLPPAKELDRMGTVGTS